MKRTGLIAAFALGSAVLLGGCAAQSEMDALRNDVAETQRMTQALQQDVTALRQDVQQAAQAANSAAQSARDAAAEARAARDDARLAAEKADRIQRSTLRK